MAKYSGNSYYVNITSEPDSSGFWGIVAFCKSERIKPSEGRGMRINCISALWLVLSRNPVRPIAKWSPFCRGMPPAEYVIRLCQLWRIVRRRFCREIQFWTRFWNTKFANRVFPGSRFSFGELSEQEMLCLLLFRILCRILFNKRRRYFINLLARLVAINVELTHLFYTYINRLWLVRYVEILCMVTKQQFWWIFQNTENRFMVQWTPAQHKQKRNNPRKGHILRPTKHNIPLPFSLSSRRLAIWISALPQGRH